MRAFAVICVLQLSLLANEPSANPDYAPFINEYIEFELSYLGLNIARAHMNLTKMDDENGINIVFHVDTRSIANLLFKVHNEYETIIDTAGLPIMTSKQVNQKNIVQNITIRYDREQLLAYSNLDTTWSIPDSCFDILSMIYSIRSGRTEHGQRLEYLLDIESQFWCVKGRVANAKPIHGPFEHLVARQITLTFYPFNKMKPRRWKTDLLTNRIARDDGKLVLFLGPPPQNLPLFVQFGEGGAKVEMKLRKVRSIPGRK